MTFKVCPSVQNMSLFVRQSVTQKRSQQNIERLGMRHQLLMGEDRKTAHESTRQMGLPSRENHQIPTAVVTDAVQSLENLNIIIEGTQQRTAPFHVGQPGTKPRGNPLRRDSSPLRTANTHKATGASGTIQLLQPDSPDDASHRKTKQVHLNVVTPALTDVIVELFRQGAQGNSA